MTGLLEGKKALVFGVANERSIAWGIAQELNNHGAKVGFSYAMPELEKRVRPLAESLGSDFVEKCDVSSDAEIAEVMGKAQVKYGKIDILVHSIAFANSEELKGPFYNTSRAGFHTAMDVSVYSLVALVKAALHIMNQNGSVLTMTHHGSQQIFENYNVMGTAKAALEATVRALAFDLGKDYKVRVNAISAGPINTLSARGISGFSSILDESERVAPLGRNVTPTDIGKAAVYLCSDLAAGVTGQVHYVDAGLSTVAFTRRGIEQQKPSS